MDLPAKPDWREDFGDWLETKGIGPAQDESFWAAYHSGSAKEINQVCVLLIEELDKRKNLQRQGETQIAGWGKALALSTINNAAYEMLQSRTVRSRPPTRKLLKLFQDLLGVMDFDEEHKYDLQFLLVALLTVARPKLGLRKIGKFVGVDHTTIRNWRSREDFAAYTGNLDPASAENSLRVLILPEKLEEIL